MEISKELLENYCPALINPTDTLFNKLAGYIDNAIAALAAFAITDDFLTTTELQRLYAETVCTRAAYEAIPSLDLVATPTGFGVVSNNNVAPASRERVDALREQLREQNCKAYERLILALIRATDWRTSTVAATVVTSLLFLPCHLRRYGVTLDGKPIYLEEKEKMAARIADAERQLEFLISPELHAHLIACQLTDPDDHTADITIEQARLYLASILSAAHPRARTLLANRLLATVRKVGFEQYTNSSTAAAQTAAPYQNERQHPTFFFS